MPDIYESLGLDDLALSERLMSQNLVPSEHPGAFTDARGHLGAPVRELLGITPEAAPPSPAAISTDQGAPLWTRHLPNPSATDNIMLALQGLRLAPGAVLPRMNPQVVRSMFSDAAPVRSNMRGPVGIRSHVTEGAAGNENKIPIPRFQTDRARNAYIKDAFSTGYFKPVDPTQHLVLDAQLARAQAARGARRQFRLVPVDHNPFAAAR